MEKIIIFGGCGFLGSWIVRAFLKNGYSVSIFDLKIKKELRLKELVKLLI